MPSFIVVLKTSISSWNLALKLAWDEFKFKIKYSWIFLGIWESWDWLYKYLVFPPDIFNEWPVFEFCDEIIGLNEDFIGDTSIFFFFFF